MEGYKCIRIARHAPIPFKNQFLNSWLYLYLRIMYVATFALGNENSSVYLRVELILRD